jgi:acetate---CoA ligase (ADP-forming)
MTINPTRASTGTLDALFHPKAVAFIGASERPNTPASRGLRNCLRHGFKGDLVAVNPKYLELFGTKCFPSIQSLPLVPDLAVIALPAEATLEAVTHCRDAGIKAVVACSSGWGEAGPEGSARAERLRQILAGSATRLLGPNVLGIGNAAIGLSLGYNSSFESVALDPRGRIGLVTQSGAMMGGLILNAEDVGARTGLYAHVGNAMDIGLEEMIEHMVGEPAIDVIAVMVEGLHEPQRFRTAVRRARECGKPVVVFKAGASELGRVAVQSHTGALAGSDEVFTAVCREEGVVRVEESEDLMQTASAFVSWKGKRRLQQGGLLIYTLSGGAASVLADECEGANVDIARLGEQTRARLAGMLPSYLSANNPLDVGGAVFSDPDLPGRALEVALQDDNVSSVLWVGVGAPRDDRSRMLLDQATEALARSNVASAVIPLSGYPQERGFERARDMQIPVFRSLRSAARIISYVGAAQRPVAAHGTAAQLNTDVPEAGIADEVRSKAVLSKLGIPVPDFRIAATPEAAASAAAELGFPVVVKGIAEGVAHKTEHGLVAVGLDSAEKAAQAALSMASGPMRAVMRSFLVEKMAPAGVEVVVGIKNDEAFGPILMFGLGGVSLELFHDVAFGTCPLSAEGAHDLIGRTRAAQLLRGYRGSPPADTDALVAAMVRLSQFAHSNAGTLAEMDVNPIRVLPAGQGVIALDAVIMGKHD